MNLFGHCSSPTVNHLDWETQMETVMECYKFAAEEDDDPRNLNIPELEGSHDVQGPMLEIPKITEIVKTKKEREKAWHNRHIKQKTFMVGDLVLRQ